MAYYPAQATQVVSVKTTEEMQTKVQAALADGWFPVTDTSVWDAKLVPPTEAYRQTMVKYENTDAQYIAAMYAAFQSILEGINSQLATANSRLQQIVTNTNRISDTAAPAPGPVQTQSQSQETKVEIK